MSYYSKRRLAILFFFLIIFSIIGYWIYLKYFKVYPTCNDGIQNQGEEGIDCGGPCKKICTFKAEKANLDWVRVFEVIPGVYNIAGLIENPNFYYGYKVSYEIRYINQDDMIIGKIRDTVFLKPLQKKIIFYPGIQLKGQKIKRVYFYKTQVSDLVQMKPEKEKISIKTKELIEDKNGFSKLKIVLYNNDIVPKNSLNIYGILIDDKDNVIDLSKTYYEMIGPRQEAEIYLTWRKKIEKKVAEIKVFVEEMKDKRINILEY